jgi:putative transposase
VARARRFISSNVVYHVYNRRTDKQCLFPDSAFYDDLVNVIRRAKCLYATQLHGYCFLHNHVHLVASAQEPAELVGFLKWISSTHAIRFRCKTETRGLGHVYQDRYKAKAATDAVHYATLIRYIERNPVDAEVVARAEDWPWSSLRERVSERSDLIEPGPWKLPSNWLEIVNAPVVNMGEVPELLGQTSAFRPAPQAFPELAPTR